MNILTCKCWSNATAYMNCYELISLRPAAITGKPIAPIKCTHPPNSHTSHIQRQKINFYYVFKLDKFGISKRKVVTFYANSSAGNFDIFILKKSLLFVHSFNKFYMIFYHMLIKDFIHQKSNIKFLRRNGKPCFMCDSSRKYQNLGGSHK